MYLEAYDRNPYGTNCWLLSAEDSDEAVVVDLGFDPDVVHQMLDTAGKTPVAVLLTHAHVDHAQDAGDFAGSDIPVWVHPADAVAFDDPVTWGSFTGADLAPVSDLRTFEDGQKLSFPGFDVTVRHTPGHTPGHCIFVTDALVFSGDLVFAGTVGRSDFPNSDPVAMENSLRLFLDLPDQLPVHPGHGATTTVGRERASNPFLKALA